MTTLTINNINEFKNKIINIYCKQWEGNADVYGQAIIIDFNEDERNPIKVGNATGEGHYLEYAIINEDGVICIGDEDRPVEVELSENGLQASEVIENAFSRTFNPANGYTTIPFNVKRTNTGVQLLMTSDVLNAHYLNIIRTIAENLDVNWHINFADKKIIIN